MLTTMTAILLSTTPAIPGLQEKIDSLEKYLRGNPKDKGIQRLLEKLKKKAAKAEEIKKTDAYKIGEILYELEIMKHLEKKGPGFHKDLLEEKIEVLKKIKPKKPSDSVALGELVTSLENKQEAYEKNPKEKPWSLKKSYAPGGDIKRYGGRLENFLKIFLKN